MKKQLYIILYKDNSYNCNGENVYFSSTFTDSLSKVAELLSKETNRVFEFPQLKEVTKADIIIQ